MARNTSEFVAVDCGKVRPCVCSQIHEYYIFFAAPSNPTVTQDSPRVGYEDNLLQYCRIVGWHFGLIVLVLRFKHTQVDMVIDELVDCVFKGIRLNLLQQRDRQHPRLFIGIIAVSCHTPLPFVFHSHSTPKPQFMLLFLQPR